MAVTMGHRQSMCTSGRGSAKRSTCEAWFALNRRAYQTILNMAIQAEMNMTSAEAMERRRARLGDVISGQELAAELTSSLDKSLPPRPVDSRRSPEVAVHSPSDDVTPDSTRDPDDVVELQLPLSFSRHRRDPDDVISGAVGSTTADAESSISHLPGVAMPLEDDKKSTDEANENSGDGDIVWTAIDKRTLVTLVDQLTTGSSIPSDRRQTPTSDELHSRELTSGVGPEVEIHESKKRESAEGTYEKESDEEQGRGQTQLPTAGQGRETHPDIKDQERQQKDVSSHDEIVDLSPKTRSCSGALKPKWATQEAQPRGKPNTAKNRHAGSDKKATSGAFEKSGKMTGDKGPLEVWTSVDKSLVEGLFDQLLQSFDDVNVSEPEVEKSRDPLSANDRRPTTDLRSWSSAAYKWKSHLLQRMSGGQEVTQRHVALCRKRRYADRKLI